MTLKTRDVLILVFLASVVLICAAYANTFPKWFPFNHENALEEWQEKIFKDRVLYTVMSQENKGFLQAYSERASSGLFHKIRFAVNEYPMISWQWKVTHFPQKSSGDSSAGGWLERDDYAGRVYVIFPSWNFTQTKSLEYVWDESLPEGQILTSPYLNNIKLLVVESGKENLNQWIAEERNIAEDYRKAFGRNPPRYVGAIALMTDSDNSLSTAETFYKDFKVGYSQYE